LREHQIVITLKPDQFLEVQRLARAANAKSMGIFVRQKLLAALGIEGAPGADAASGPQPENIEAAVSQVRRLHGELKMFVAESLSMYSLDAMGEQITIAISSDAAAIDEAASTANDALENVADRTFAISPRLGSIGAAAAPGETPSRAPQDTAAKTQPEMPAGRHDGTRQNQHRSTHVAPKQNAGQTNPPAISDPLDKLLPGEHEFKPAFQAEPRSIEAVDDAMIPLSLAERARQTAWQNDPQATAAAAAADSASRNPMFYFEDDEIAAAIAAEAQTRDALESMSTPTQPVEVEPQIDAITTYDAPTELDDIEGTPPADTNVQPNPAVEPPKNKPRAQRSLDYPSLSGSPPPKRRQL
jgi:hypothetical protein